MQKTVFIILLIFIFTFPVLSNQNEKDKKPYFAKNVVKIWETTKGMMIPESVLYDPSDNVIYVSNINGNPSKKDGKGFISKLTPDGKITDLKWVSGLNAPKGMGLFSGKLYVADIDEVIEISVLNKKVVMKHRADGAKFLNDIAVDGNGSIYISDMDVNRIYILKNGKLDIWIDSKKLNHPNGLYILKESILIGNRDMIIKAGLSDKVLKSYVKNTGGIDGLELDNSGNIFFSDWQGRVFKYGTDKSVVKIIDTTGIKKNAADIGFIKKSNIILVPTFFANGVTAYKIN